MDLAILQQITELKMQRSQAKLAETLARETALRADLDRLRTMAYQTHEAGAEAVPMRSIGADIIWLRWIDEATRKLNLELAQVLAQKEFVVSDHKKHFGKDLVAKEMVSQHHREESELKKQRRLADAIQISQTMRLISTR